MSAGCKGSALYDAWVRRVDRPLIPDGVIAASREGALQPVEAAGKQRQQAAGLLCQADLHATVCGGRHFALDGNLLQQQVEVVCMACCIITAMRVSKGANHLRRVPSAASARQPPLLVRAAPPTAGNTSERQHT